MRGKSVLGKDRDGNRNSQVNADCQQGQDDEDDRLTVTRRPVRRFVPGAR